MKFHISSLIENIDDNGLCDGSPERESFTVDGELEAADGAYMLRYTELRDDARVECEITLHGDKVTVRRMGAVECKMHFKQGITHRSVYTVPPFSFDMSLETVRLENSMTERGGDLYLLYKMEIGGQEKRCRFTLSAK